MPLYHFDIDDGDVHTSDKFGVELADLGEATVEAAVLAGELLRDRPQKFWAAQEWKLTVEDSNGMILFTIVVAAIVAPAASAAIKTAYSTQNQSNLDRVPRTSQCAG